MIVKLWDKTAITISDAKGKQLEEIMMEGNKSRSIRLTSDTGASLGVIKLSAISHIVPGGTFNNDQKMIDGRKQIEQTPEQKARTDKIKNGIRQMLKDKRKAKLLSSSRQNPQ